MRKVLVAVSFVLPALALGQAELVFKPETNQSIQSTLCGAVGADLDFAIRTANRREPVAYITLKNFYSVVKNSTAQVLSFHINKDSVGFVQLSNGSKRWTVDPRVSKDAGCDVDVIRESAKTDPNGNTVSLKLRCQDLSLNSPKLSIAQRQQQILRTAEITEPLHCSIQAQRH